MLTPLKFLWNMLLASEQTQLLALGTVTPEEKTLLAPESISLPSHPFMMVSSEPKSVIGVPIGWRQVNNLHTSYKALREYEFYIAITYVENWQNMRRVLAAQTDECLPH